MKEELTKDYKKGYKDGLIDGITRYAWWKDGTQYVGTTGKTCKEALEYIEKNYND